MKIKQKLTLGFISIAVLVAAVGYFSLYVSKKTLQKRIMQGSAILASEMLEKIDRHIYMRIETFQEYCRDLIMRRIILKSNKEFDKLDDIQAYIDKHDHQWTSVPKEETTALIQELLNNELSEELKEKIEFYEKKYGFEVFGEVFITNKYGANVAQTEKTTDYYQADEKWWRQAKENGLYVGDVGYDESADVYSIDICIRVDDEKGDFLGVTKVVLNIKDCISVLEKVIAAEVSIEFKLLTKDKKIIYATEEYKFLEKLSGELLSYFLQERYHHPYFIAEGDKPNEDEELVAYAHSNGYKGYKGLGWILLVEQKTEEIFAPAARLGNWILIISLVSMVLAIVFGLFISRSISVPIRKLTLAATGIGKGNLDTRVSINSNDEIGQLGASFNEMSDDLKKSIDHLNLEVAIRKKAESKIQQQNEFLNNVLEALTHPFYVINADDYTIKIANRASNFDGSYKNLTCYALTHKRSEPCDGANDPCPVKKIKETKKPLVVEHIHYDKDNNARNVEVHGYPILDSQGNVTQVIEYSLDITERKKAEQTLQNLNEELELTVGQLRRSNQELQTFTYVASHDLREPLRKISAFGEMLAASLKNKLNEDEEENLSFMVDGANRMQQMIEALLTYSRVTTKSSNFEPVDPNAVV